MAFDYQLGMETYQKMFRSLMENLPPEVLEKMDERMTESIDQMAEQEFHVFEIVQQMFGLVLASIVGGSIGGLIGSAVFKKGPEAK